MDFAARQKKLREHLATTRLNALLISQSAEHSISLRLYRERRDALGGGRGERFLHRCSL
jgi:hypothetical protein